jgi:hypothetical protein
MGILSSGNCLALSREKWYFVGKYQVLLTAWRAGGPVMKLNGKSRIIVLWSRMHRLFHSGDSK